MSDFLKMDVFFFVTTVAIVVLTTLGTIILWRLARILKNIERVSEQLYALFHWLRPDAKKSSKKSSLPHP